MRGPGDRTDDLPGRTEVAEWINRTVRTRDRRSPESRMRRPGQDRPATAGSPELRFGGVGALRRRG